MRLIIRDDAATASQYVAEYIVARIKAFAPTPDKPFVLGLPTGSSPEIIYKILVQKYKNGEISFKNVVTFNMVSKPCVLLSLVPTQLILPFFQPSCKTFRTRTTRSEYS